MSDSERPTPMGNRTLGLRRNVALNIGSKSFSILTSLFSAPFIVYHIGLRAFGFWALIAAFSQYAALLNFGVGSVLTRYVAELHSLRDYDDLARKGATSFYISISFAVLIMASLCTFCVAIPHSLTNGWPPGWQWAILGVGVTMSSGAIASVFQAFPGGMARWDLQNLPEVIFQVVFLAAIVIMLSAGLGLKGVGISSAVASLAFLTSAWLASRRVWRQAFRLSLTTREDFGLLFRYGMNLQLANMVLIINIQSDKPVLLAFGGSLKFIAFYELASKLAFQVRSLPVMALAPLTARVAFKMAGRPVSELREFYERSLTYIVSYGVAPLFAVFGACWPLVLVWLGTGYTVTAEIAVILGTGYAINLITGAGTAIAQGCGRPEIDRNYSLLGLGINIALTVALGALVGPWGVIIATAVGMSASSLWLLHSMDRWVGTATFTLSGPLRQTAAPVCVGILCGATTLVAVQFVPTDSRWLCLAYGTLSLLVFGAIWATITPTVRTMLWTLRRRLARTYAQ